MSHVIRWLRRDNLTENSITLNAGVVPFMQLETDGIGRPHVVVYDGSALGDEVARLSMHQVVAVTWTGDAETLNAPEIALLHLRLSIGAYDHKMEELQRPSDKMVSTLDFDGNMEVTFVKPHPIVEARGFVAVTKWFRSDGKLRAVCTSHNLTRSLNADKGT